MSCFFWQIFFHYSELAEAAESDLALGTSVEFVIQNRQVNGKDCSINFVHWNP